MLRHILMASAGALALTGVAFAADLPLRTPPPVYLPPPPLWTGLYVGINAGYTWSNSNSVDTDAVPGGCNPGTGGCIVATPPINVISATLATFDLPAKTSGFIGGGQIGYNYQFYNNWVAGIEADIQGVAGNNGSSSFSSKLGTAAFPLNPIDQTASVSKRLDYLGTVRGRLGFTLTPTFLVYGTGGLAYGGVQSSTNISQFLEGVGAAVAPNPYSSFGSFSNSRVGWTAGGGVEWLFAPNWSIKAEYLYYDLGRLTHSLTPLATFLTADGSLFYSAFPQSSTRFTGNIVRAGLNYHFSLAPPPIIAKY